MTNYRDAKYQIPTSGVTSGTFADARISASSVVQHSPETDLQPLKADLTALALREATNEASAAFNLPNQFIETFTDDTKLGTQTTGDRVSGYWATVYTSTALGRFTSDSDTSALIHSDTSDGSTTFTDSSAHGKTVAQFGGGGTEHSTDYPPPTYLGTTAIHATGSGGIYINGDADFQFGTGDFCFEWWEYNNGTPSTGDRTMSFGGTHEWFRRPDWNNGTDWIRLFNSAGGTWAAGLYGSEPTLNTWTHFAFSKVSGVYRVYVNGVHWSTGSTYPLTRSSDSMFTATHDFSLFGRGPDSTPGEYAQSNYYLTEIRISKGNGRYPSGTTFTPNSVASSSASATGTLIQSANTVASATTKVGGTMLYKDNAGTATLGTDLKIYFSCNNGGAWTEAASYNAITPVYSTGIKQVRLGETTCTSGTGVIYKAVWANQAASSKETQLHGIGINY